MESQLIVVDDDFASSQSICDILLSSGHHAVRAESDSTRIVALLQSQTAVDAAIINVSMPDGSGQEVLAAIHANSPSTECVTIADPADKADAIRALSSGAYGFLVKPFAREELVALVARALERKALLDTLREDASLLSRYFLKKWGLKGEAARLEASAAAVLAAYRCPGNLNELEADLREAVAAARGKPIEIEHLPGRMRRAGPAPLQETVPPIPELRLAEIEKEHILNVYRRANCNKVRTARALGIGLNTLRRKLKAYDEK